jgi:hypothetical protein
LFPKLQHLSVLGFLHDDGGMNPRTVEEDGWLFERAVAECPHLVDLDVFDNDNSSDELEGIGFGSTWQDHEWKCRSTLRSLRVVSPRKDLSAPRWKFAQHFAATLESLDLGSLPTSAEVDALLNTSPSDNHTMHFPCLRTLAADVTERTACLLLRRFASSPLQHLRLRPPHDSP